MPLPPRDPSTLPSIERLRELLYIDGRHIRRTASRGKWAAHTIAGGDNGSGYLVILVDGIRIKAHRVAFALHHGRWPGAEVDHIDGDRTNNAPANLRDVTRSQNMQNRACASSASKTGYLGVSRTASGKWKGRYRYRISVNGKRLVKDGFLTAEAAHDAYLEMKRKHHPFAVQAFK